MSKEKNIKLTAIVAVDKNWAIGNNNNLLVHIPADLKRFKNETIGETIIYGRKTLLSFPNASSLQFRKNIILSTDSEYYVHGATVVHNMQELFDEVDRSKAYVIGGATVYTELLPYCECCLVTKIDAEYPADSYFPNLEKDNDWFLDDVSETYQYDNISYTFQKYIRK